MRGAKIILWLVLVLGLSVVVLNSEIMFGGATSASAAYPSPGTPTPTPRSGQTPSPPRVFIYFPYIAHAPGPAPVAPQISVVGGEAYTLVWQRSDGPEANAIPSPQVIVYVVYETHSASDGIQERELATVVSRLANESFSVPITPPAVGVNAYRVVARNYLASVTGNEVKLPARPRFDDQVVDGRGGRYTLRWSSVAGANLYILEEATSAVSTSVTQSWFLEKDTRQYELGPQVLGTYWYRVTARTADTAIHSEWKAVQAPRPGLWGIVRYKGTPKSGVSVDLMRCTVNNNDPRYCEDDVQVDTVETLADGSYNFTNVPPTTDPSVPGKQYQLYVEFTNDADPSYLLEWISKYIKWPQDAGPNGTAEASSFDIMNIPLVSPAPYALQPLPVTFVWQRRSLAGDSYGIRFSKGDLTTPLYTKPLGDVDSFGPLIDVRPLRMNAEYWWQAWVNVDNQGHGRSYYGRPITFVTRPPAARDASLDSLKSLLAPQLPPFSARPPHLEP